MEKCLLRNAYTVFCLAVAAGLIVFSANGQAPGGPPMPKPPPEPEHVKRPDKTGLIVKTEEVSEGYVLIATRGHTSTYLIDSDGNVVHEWKHQKMASMSAFLLPNGNLLHTVRYSDDEVGDIVQELSWDGEIVWEYTTDRSVKRIHHDIQRLSNGNTLITVWELKSLEEYTAAGRNPDTVPNEKMWVDAIYEVKPTGKTSGDIVWRWSAWDHLVQMFDENLPNYGDPAMHPNLIDVNQLRVEKGEFTKLSDWLHINAIACDPKRPDEIIISSHSLSEMWVVSRKTGEIIYRWGNPRRYRKGGTESQILFNQHDPHWIPDGLRGEGNLLVFNNDAGIGKGDGVYSSVLEVCPPLSDSGKWPTINENGIYPPCEVVWEYTGAPDDKFYSVAVSNAQRLQGGGTLITAGVNGIVFEIDAKDQLVWKYVNPIFRRGPKLKKLEKWNAAPPPGENMFFRAYKYAPDYEAFSGRKLSPKRSLKEIGDEILETHFSM